MISVIVPTYNRVDILGRVLEALGAATTPDGGFEVIVVSDGSTDGTEELLHDWRPDYPFRWVGQENQGPGRARNHGAELASGDRILFIGDDTVPDREFLVRHQERAGREVDPTRIAVLGRTEWHPDMELNPFLDHINEYGLQFGYALIDDPENVPFNFFYTSNISLDRALFERLGGFDTDFPVAAWEDVEFAFRACRQEDLRIVYEPSARTAHYHPTTVATFTRRQEKAGLAATIFARKHPELHDWLGLPCIDEVGSPIGMALTRKWLELGTRVGPLFSPVLCDRLMRQHYLRGVSRALRENDP